MFKMKPFEHNTISLIWDFGKTLTKGYIQSPFSKNIMSTKSSLGVKLIVNKPINNDNAEDKIITQIAYEIV